MTQINREDLPIWMQNSLRGTDWGVLIVLVFSLLAGWPFLLQPGLPRTNASEHYVYRAADTAQAFAEGRLYPRWSPNALMGYGAPIPQYYPPGATFVPALIDFFITNDPTLAVKLVYALALCLAGAAIYAFVARRSGAGGGRHRCAALRLQSLRRSDRAPPARRPPRRDQPGADSGAALER